MLVFFFSGEILLIKSTGIELGASASAIGAHRLKCADEFGALLLDESDYFSHYLTGVGVSLHTEAAAGHEHQLLRVYVHHVRNGGILRSLGSVVVLLTVVSLALHKVGNTDKVTAEMYRNVIGNYHLDAEIECSYRAVLAHEQLVSPLGGGELGACLSYGVESTTIPVGM